MEKILEDTELRRRMGARVQSHNRADAPYTVTSVRSPQDRFSFDAEYVRLLAAGDSVVSDHFARYFSDLLRVKLQFRLRSSQAVEDALQDVFLRVLTLLRRDGGLEHPERLGAFVNVVCNNVLFEIYRQHARTPGALDDQPDIPDTSEDVESALVTKDRKLQMRRVLEELPTRDRDLLRKVFLEEQDKDQVCREMNVDRNHLRLLVHRAKGRFRLLMQRRERPLCGGQR